MLPEGEYKLVAKKWGFDRSPKKGTPYFWISGPVVAQVVEVEGEVVEEELENRVNRKLSFYLSPTAVEFSRSRLKKCGYTQPTLAQLNPAEDDAHDFTDTVIQVKVSHKPGDNDKVFESVEVSDRRAVHNFKDDELASVLALADKTLANLDKAGEEVPI
jgi:hypothetical protein